MTRKPDANPCCDILDSETVEAMARARKFLVERDTNRKLGLVGRTIDSLALKRPAADKSRFPASYGGGKACGNDLLAADGMFYIDQSGKAMLDCTAGHYQMTWGYNHPALVETVTDAQHLGIVWDNHSNIPSLPVKMLAEELVALSESDGLDRVLLGICTGSVACSTALKIMLARYLNDPGRMRNGVPVMVTLAGNYHGTDMVAQTMRGMWPGLVSGMETVQVEPNDPDMLRKTFRTYGGRVAGFWAEPIMMNREAITVSKKYLQLARELCDAHGALMAIDEIQTCFWYPEILAYKRLGIRPDLVVIGKGMSAGFHPLSGLLFRSEHDILAQYDAVSTNGNASLASMVALCNLRMMRRDRERIAALAAVYYDGMCTVAADFPDLIQEVTGAGLLCGLKFCNRDDALGFHKAAVEQGLWLRVHAYHEGHRTVLTKCALVVDETIVAFIHARIRELLREKPWQKAR